MRLPSDNLAKTNRRAPWIIGSVASAALIVAAVIAGPSVAAQLTPAPTPTETAIVADSAPTALTASDIDSIQQAAEAQHDTIIAEQEAQAAAALLAQQQADAAAAAAAHAAQHHSSSAGSVHGRKVPFIKSTDPQNANGGDWDMSVCQGGSASTGADGTPYCD